MWSIQINDRGHLFHVTVCRWGAQGPYPAQLLELDLMPRPDESELALIQRVGRAIYAEASYRRTSR